jgi:hypothetical protein
MSAALRGLKIAVVGTLVALLAACASNYPTRTANYAETALDRPLAQPGEAELLSVRIEAFDTGTLPEDPEVAKGLSPEIRGAEAYYIPVQLKNTMQKSGHWGAVRVVPKATREGEVVVSGRILESDGEILKVSIDVKDATGVPWFAKEYESVVDAEAYRKAELGSIDAFQDLYNRIANDIAAYKKTLKANDSTAIRQVADLRFGTEFAPDVFNNYLRRSDEKTADSGLATFRGQSGNTRKPVYTVARLPSDDDPIVQRVSRIRTREEFLVDTLDQQYDGLARGVGDAYTKWRTARLKEINAIHETDRVQNRERAKGAAIGVLGLLAGGAIASQDRDKRCRGCATTGVAVGAVAVAVGVQMAMQASEQASAETSLHKAALEELGQSLSADVKPTVVEVEGKTVELKGTIEEKFQQWRDVLKGLRDNETAPLVPATGTPTT